MAQPIVKYAGDDITCYPGSNQKDDGKLQLEFNMARLVTRVSSKNFCIIKPSFEITAVSDEATNKPKLEIASGQASINGMDLIMNNSIRIDPPEGEGTYYLAFKLARDSSRNVLGDLVVGVTTTFEGVYLTYYDTKPEPLTDMDMLYLGQVTWDGEQFSDIVEDEDKYGRIWAEDILCKLEDPKHPDDTRLNLQEYVYNMPDWYFSKEGDTVYGPIIIADNRDNNNAGIIMNVDKDGSHLTIKDPNQDNDKLQFYGDVNRDGVIDQKDIDLIKKFIDGSETPSDLQKILGDVNHDGVIDDKDIEYIQNFINKDGNGGDTGNIYYIDKTDDGISFDTTNGESIMNIGESSIYINEGDNYTLHLNSPNHIEVKSNKTVFVRGDEAVEIGTTDEKPKLTMKDDIASFTDSSSPNLKFDINFVDANNIQNTIGKAIWQYNLQNKYISLLQTDVTYLEIVPNALFRQNARVQNTLYIGGSDTDTTTPQTTLQRTSWWLREATAGGDTMNLTPKGITIYNNTSSDNSSIKLQNAADSVHTIVRDDAYIELLNGSVTPKIVWRDNNTAYNVTLEKIINEKRLNLQGSMSITNALTVSQEITGSGLTTANGVLTFKNGNNNATITKDSNATNIRTSGPFYVGPTGTQSLFAGNTVINGTFAVGGTTNANSPLKIDKTGNLTTTGTITGSKVYGAVYNDFGEIFRKDKTEIIDYGDIVCLRDDGLVHKVETEKDLQTIIGICSNTIGLQLGGADVAKEEQVEVGLVGKIWVKTKELNITPGQWVKAISDGSVITTSKKEEKFAIALTNVVNGKVEVLYKG